MKNITIIAATINGTMGGDADRNGASICDE
jgi:hypothetical protein